MATNAGFGGTPGSISLDVTEMKISLLFAWSSGGKVVRELAVDEMSMKILDLPRNPASDDQLVIGGRRQKARRPG